MSSSTMSLNGGTLDISNSSLNINRSNITLVQNYGIAGGITDICSNMFNVLNSNISLPASTVFGSNLGLNNLWTGKNTMNNDVSFNNTKTQINSSSLIGLSGDIVNISGGSVTVAGYTTIGGGSTIFNSNNIYLNSIPSTSDLSCISYNPTTKQIGYVNLPNNLPTNNVWTGTNTFSTDVSFNSGTARFNNTTTQITSSSLVGLSGGVVSISGGTVNIAGATTISGTSTHTGASVFNNNTTFSGSTNTFSSTTTQINGSSLVGLSGGVVNISGGTVNISGSSTTLSGILNLPSITNKTTGQSTYSSVIYNPTSSEVSHSSQLVQKPISNTTLSIAQQFIVGVMNGANTVNYGSFASISSDGNTLAVSAYGSNSVYMYTRTGSSWNTGSPQIITGPSGSLVFSKLAVSLSKDGNTLAVGDTNKNTAYIYTKSGATTWNTTPSFSPTGPNQYFGSCVALSSDGYTFAVGDWSTNGVYIYSRTSATTWNATPTKLICMYNGISFPTLLSFSDDGNTLAVGAYSGRLVFIYSRTGSTWNTVPQTIGAPYDYGSFGTSVSISSDGNTLAIGDDQGGCAFLYKQIGGYWNKQPFATFINDNGGVYGWSVSLSNDGNTLAVGATGIKTIYVYRCVNNVWDTNPKIRYTESSNQAIGYPVVLSGDGTTLGAGTSTAGNYFYVYSITPTNTILGNGIGIGVNSQTKYTLDVSGDVNLNNTLYTNNNKTTFTQIYTYDYAAITNNALTGLGCSALSPDGNMIAFCSPNDLDYMYPGNGGYGGIVKVYKRYGAIWTQYGQQLTSSQSGSYFGRMSCFSNDGKLAISAPFMANYGTTTTAGTVYVYYYNNSNNLWTLINSIGYGTSYYQFGFSLAFSLDGNTLAIGGSGHASNTYTGIVQIYTYNGNSYIGSQSLNLPPPPTSTLANTSFGRSVALSDDGNILAVGAPGNGSSNAGTVWIYRRSGSTWGSSPYSFNITTSGYLWIGIEVSLSGDGNTIAIQCSTSSGGAVLIYTYDGTNWNLKQNINTNSIATDSKTLALSKDAMKLYVCQAYNTVFYEYDTTTNLYVKNDIGGILYPTKTCVSMSYDSRIIALGNQWWNNGSNGGRIDIFEIETTKQLTIANELFIGTPGGKGVIYMGGGGLGDNGYQHSVIESRKYSGGESTELLLFKGNDGDDRIRLRGGQICFDTYNPTGNINRIDENIKMIITNGGNVGIGTANPSQRLDVVGDVKASNSYVDKVTHTFTIGIDRGNWFKIACLYSYRNWGVFNLSCYAAGEHINIKFSTGFCYEGNPYINIISNTYYGTPFIQNIRLSHNINNLAGEHFVEMQLDNTPYDDGGHLEWTINVDITLLESYSNTLSLYRSKTAGTSGGYNYYTLSTYISQGINTNGYSVFTDTVGNFIFSGSNYLEFGRNATKEVNAGKIGYQTFSTVCLDIVGAGAVNNNRKVRIYDFLGIGLNDPKYPLHINGAAFGTTTANIGDYYQIFTYGANQIAQSSTTFSGRFCLIVENGNIVAQTVFATNSFSSYSDTRIKTNIVDIDDEKSLQTLRLIKPKTYDYIDKLKRGNDNVIGFIAQEIKEIIPKAVSIVKDYIPNFMTLCQVTQTDVSNIVLVTSHIDLSWNPLHDQSGNEFLDASGNASSDASGNKFFNVKLYDQSNNEIVCKTTDILDKRTFLMDISGTEMANVSCNIDSSGNIVLGKDGVYFLYGQEIDDFHTLDKNAIFTVVTAAVQDIDRIQQAQQVQIQESLTRIQAQQVQIQESLTKIQEDALKISELQSKNAMLESTVATLESTVASHQSQITALENKLSSMIAILGLQI